ncbi:MAG: DUF4388 domain-containing protein [Planctomycetota bacterium]
MQAIRRLEQAALRRRAIRDLRSSLTALDHQTDALARAFEPHPGAAEATNETPNLDHEIRHLEAVLHRLKSITVAGARTDHELTERLASTNAGGSQGETVLEGTTSQVPLAAVLETLAMGRKSGTLQVLTHLETATIALRDGRVVHAQSDNAPPQDRLGAILLEAGEVDPELLELTLGPSDGAAVRGFAGDTLAGQHVEPTGICRALGEQVRRLLMRLTLAPQAAFCFQTASEGWTQDAVKLPRTRVDLEPRELVLETARRLDERSTAYTGWRTLTHSTSRRHCG